MARLIASVLTVALCSVPAAADDERLGGLPIKEQPARFRVLFGPGGQRAQTTYARELRLSEPSPIQFKGPGGDKNFIDDYRAGGVFMISGDALVSPQDHTAALHLATGENFDVEAVMDSSAVGGMFLLVGWTGESGYLIHQITLRTSEAWILYEHKGQFVELARLPMYRWTEGYRPVALSVRDKKLTLRVGDGYLCREQEMPYYARGQVLLGTTSTAYGPKLLKIKSLKVRSVGGSEK